MQIAKTSDWVKKRKKARIQINIDDEKLNESIAIDEMFTKNQVDISRNIANPDEIRLNETQFFIVYIYLYSSFLSLFYPI
jgi:hypothetical protein